MSVDLKEKSIALLSTVTGINLQSATATVLYTVPTGKTCILDRAKLVLVTTATTSATGQVGIGRSTALTDFVGPITLTNLVGVGDTVTISQVPNSTPVAAKTYAAGIVISINVSTLDADGPSAVTCLLYGTLY